MSTSTFDKKPYPKKILLLSDIHQGGEWIATQRLINASSRYFRNLEFSLVGFVDSKIAVPNLFKRTILIPHSTASAPFSFIKKLILDFVAIRNEVKKIISNNTYDYFLTSYYFMILPAKSLSSARKKKNIFYFHGTRDVRIKKISAINYRQLIIKILEILSLFASDIIIVPSKEAENFVRTKLGVLSRKKKFFTIPNNIPDDFFKKQKRSNLLQFKNSLQIPADARIILYCGRMAKYKGLENLIEAFNKLAKDKEGVYLIIAYPSSNQDDSVSKILNEKVKKAHTEKYIKFVKDLKQDELISLYQISDVLALASEIEMAPLAIIEAFACRTPGIGTKTGNMPYLLSKIDPLLILDNNSPKEIYKKLTYFLTLPKDTIEEIKKKSFAISRQYKEEVSAQSFARLINSIDNSAPAG